MGITKQGRGRDRMVVGFTTTCASSAYHHKRCEFKSHSGNVYSIHYNVIKFVSDLQQVSGFLWVIRFPPPIKLTESGIKHHNPNLNPKQGILPASVLLKMIIIQLNQLLGRNCLKNTGRNLI